MNEHERGFLDFLAEPTRRRMETLLSLGAKRRQDVRSLLDHSISLDERYSEHLGGSDGFAAPLELRLRKLGAPSNCHVLASDPTIDGRQMPVRDSLHPIIGRGGAYVSCIPGHLGFYEYAEMKRSFLLAR